MRRATLALAALMLAPAAMAQAPAQGPAAAPAVPPAAAPPAGTPQAAEEDPLVARVDGEPVRRSDVLATAAEMLPPELRSMPPAVLLPMLPANVVRQITDRTIAERALVAAARRAGLDKDPEVLARIRRAEEQELTQALLSREVQNRVSDDSVRARFERDQQNRQGEEEVHARHILVASEAEARQVLAELARGGDFAEIARRRSTDPGGRNGGDLGFFKRGDMVPEFAEAAFALQPGQTSQAPVRSPFGWHVIRVEARRAAPTQSFEEVRQTLRQQMLDEEVNAAVARIRDAARVERFDEPPAPPAAPGRSMLDNAAPPPPAGRTPVTPAQPQRR